MICHGNNMASSNRIQSPDKKGETLFINPNFVKKILSETRARPMLEICGLLLGSSGHVTEIMPMPNIAPNPRRFFEMETAGLITAHREARRRHLSVIGHYHSHPSGSCLPSATDAALAHYGQYWLIAAFNKIEGWYACKSGRIEGVFLPCELILHKSV